MEVCAPWIMKNAEREGGRVDERIIWMVEREVVKNETEQRPEFEMDV